MRFESELYHERLIEALNALPESMFQPGQAVYTYCAAAAAHYREHAQQIKDWYHVTAYGGSVSKVSGNQRPSAVRIVGRSLSAPCHS